MKRSTDDVSLNDVTTPMTTVSVHRGINGDAVVCAVGFEGTNHDPKKLLIKADQPPFSHNRDNMSPAPHPNLHLNLRKFKDGCRFEIG